MPKSKLSGTEWASARITWEGDARHGFSWLVRELSLPVSQQYVGRRSFKEGWQKRDSGDEENCNTSSGNNEACEESIRRKQIRDALFQSAMGLNEVEEQCVIDGLVVTIKRRLPPSVEAQIFWLSRRL